MYSESAKEIRAVSEGVPIKASPGRPSREKVSTGFWGIHTRKKKKYPPPNSRSRLGTPDPAV